MRLSSACEAAKDMNACQHDLLKEEGVAHWESVSMKIGGAENM